MVLWDSWGPSIRPPWCREAPGSCPSLLFFQSGAWTSLVNLEKVSQFDEKIRQREAAKSFFSRSNRMQFFFSIQYNLISVLFNKISKKILWVRQSFFVAFQSNAIFFLFWSNTNFGTRGLMDFSFSSNCTEFDCADNCAFDFERNGTRLILKKKGKFPAQS